MLTFKDKVWWFALYSRVFVLVASAIFNLLIPDHNADAFRSPQENTGSELPGDAIVKHLFGGLVRWDAQYFLHIALYGYTYENCLAFFPLFPIIIRLVAGLLLYFLERFMNVYSVLILSAILVNVICFIKSAVVLHELSLKVLNNQRLAYQAAILYCVNPASIFFSAPYSETLFALFSFYGMLKCGSGFANKFSVNCGILFGLGASARSNGILCIGFIVHKNLRHIVNHIVPPLMRDFSHLNVRSLLAVPVLVLVITIASFPLILATLLAIIPFIGFQTYAYYKFCVPHSHNLPSFLVSYAEDHGLNLPGLNSSLSNPYGKVHWCNAKLPLSYSFIQSHYWNVGFLQYYQWKQIPNFLLAAPVIFIILFNAYRYMQCNPHHFLTLGIFNSPCKSHDKSMKVNSNSAFSSELLVYVVHALSLTLFSVLFINIQVATRLIASASPVLYWFTASLFCDTEVVIKSEASWNISNHLTNIVHKNNENEIVEPLEHMYSRWKVFVVTRIPSQQNAKLIQCYFVSYFLVGTAMFSNFYPWT